MGKIHIYSNRQMCEANCKEESAYGKWILQDAVNDLVERVDTFVFYGSSSKVAQHIQYTIVCGVVI